jgi:hypothetical protein
METLETNIQRIYDYGYETEAKELLSKFEENVPEFFDNEPVKLYLNINSGILFLGSENSKVGIMRNNEIVQWITCSIGYKKCLGEGTVKEGFNELSNCCKNCEKKMEEKEQNGESL